MLPKKLKIGESIGIISPSGPVTQEHMDQFNAGVAFFKSLGFKVSVSKNAFSNSLEYSATPQEKADDIHAMFADNEIKAIVCSQGWSNSNSILPLLNFEIIKNNPKIFLGISDITVLLNAIYYKTGLVTFHGNDVMWGFGRNYTDYDKKEFVERLLEKKIGKINQNSWWKTVRNGISEGILVWWNLNCIVKLLATQKYWPDFKNKILLLEDFDMSAAPDRIDCDLHILKQHKVFDQIQGLWIGHYNHESKIPYEDIVMNVVKEYNFPILKCDDFGHNTPNTVIPIGTKVRLDATNKQVIILKDCVQ